MSDDAAVRRPPVRPPRTTATVLAGATAFAGVLVALGLQMRAGRDPALGASRPPAVTTPHPPVVVRRVERRVIVTDVIRGAPTVAPRRPPRAAAPVAVAAPPAPPVAAAAPPAPPPAPAPIRTRAS